MAAEEDNITPSSARHTVGGKSNEDDNEVPGTPQIVEQIDSNVLVLGDSDVTDSDVTDTLPEVESHEMVGVTTRTRTRGSSSGDHTPTPCLNTNHLRTIIMQATENNQPKCTAILDTDPGSDHLRSGVDTISNTTNRTAGNELQEGDNEAVREGEYM